MDWHIITGEFPPEPGGVASHSWELAKALTKDSHEKVHVWTPEVDSDPLEFDRVQVHYLPKGFGFRWWKALDRRLGEYGADDPLIVQYVPHMYGWKAMNLAFCLWLSRQGHRMLFVMFHEVAHPIQDRQPLRHRVLAVVHRFMARMVVRRAKHSFTSIEPYRQLLNQLANEAPVELLRICSNVPFSWSDSSAETIQEKSQDGPKTVGIFSSFGGELGALLEPIVPGILENPSIHVRLIGPGAALAGRICEEFPQYRHRLTTTGRVPASEVGPHLTNCDLLLQLYPDGAAAARGTLVAALASGVPVVSNSGHLTEPLFKDHNAIAFCECTPEGVRHTIENLLSDDQAAREIGSAGRRLYEDHFDIGVTVKQLRATVLSQSS